MNNKLSSPLSELQDHYDVVVVGSGYGGAVAAARLAKKGINVAVLERGKEYRPGDFPSQLGPMWEQTQIRTPVNQRPIGPRDGLFHLQIGNGISALVGCALGGTSQINAGVVAKPTDKVFSQRGTSWPQDFVSRLETYFKYVEEMLDAKSLPDDILLPKVQSLKKLANQVGKEVRFSKPKIAVSFKSGPNFAEVHQSACIQCGECVAGCNYGAKNTLTMNYLPYARTHGAKLFTRITVNHLAFPDESNCESGWVLHCHPTVGQPKSSLKVRARIVVLAAGAFGTTEILLRTQKLARENDKKIARIRKIFSERLGEGFSANGDMISFGVGHDEVRSIGYGALDVPTAQKVGPSIAGMVEVKNGDGHRDFIVQEGVAPFAVARILGEVVCTGTMIRSSLNLDARDHLAYNENWYKKTQIYLVTGHDDSSGKIELTGDSLLLNWPTAYKNEMFNRADDLLAQARFALNGQYVPNPFRWKLDAEPANSGNRSASGHAFTVHPLGGCCMAENTNKGVVNHSGQVFIGTNDNNVYGNLYVMDGSIIPCSLGINPLLTIASLAEYCVEKLIVDHKDLSKSPRSHSALESRSYPKPDSESLPSKPTMRDDSGLIFSETLIGYFKAEPALLNRAKAEGVRGASSFRKVRVDFTFEMPDAGLFLDNAKHEARLIDATMQEIPPGASETNGDPDNLLLTILPEDQKASPYSNRVELLEPPPLPALKRWAHRWFWGRPPHMFNSLFARLKELVPFKESFAKLIYKWLITESREMKYYFLAQDAHISRWKYRVEGIKIVRKDSKLPGPRALLQQLNRWWWWHWKPRNAPVEGASPAWLYRVRAWWMDSLPDDTSDLVRNRWSGEFRYRDLWDDLTHIEYKVVFDDESPFKGRVAGIGEARVDVKISNLLMRLTKQPNGIDGIASLLSAYAFIARAMIRTHLDDFQEAKYRFEETPPKKGFLNQVVGKRGVIAAEQHCIPPCNSRNTSLHLTRFEGGSNGAVLLIHGFGTASTSFAVDSIKGKNLVQYLVDLEYDVWLVDYRASVVFDNCDKIQCTLDDIAKCDLPQAVSTVLQYTHNKPLDIVAQCQGAVTFWMALLGNHLPTQSIRRVVSSQCGPILVPWYANKVKAPLADLLGKQFGVKCIRPYPLEVSKPSMMDHFVDRFLSAYPLPESEQCDNATCQRITGIYGLLYRHKNIQYRGRKDDDNNQSTHFNLHKLFGPANMTMFRHIASNFANEKILDSEGRNVYLPGITDPNLKKIPVLFIHGSDNFCFDKETAIKSAELLASHGWNANKVIIDGFGHLDCIIGDKADQHVFPHIERFLT